MRARAISSIGMMTGLLIGAAGLAGCATSAADSQASSSASLLGRFVPGTSGSPASRSILAAMGQGLVGSAVSSPLAEADRLRALEAEYQALEYSPAGKPVTWKGGDGDPSGVVVAYQPYRVGSQDCRQYTHKVAYAGQSRSVGGTACRNADGSWTPLG